MKEDIANEPGTNGENSAGILRSLCDDGFDGSVEETALVLGRTAEEIDGVLNGDEPLDEDLEMKIRGIAQERGIAIG